MDSNRCFTAVSNTISRLRAQIEKDRKNRFISRPYRTVFSAVFNLAKTGWFSTLDGVN